mmetsp:Transcript_9265/g.29455  ORF Transcript_9265/g.29455 Transcript_9265/m.29455 type:complete len:262 (+) Transcript_9265:112-897(+)
MSEPHGPDAALRDGDRLGGGGFGDGRLLLLVNDDSLLDEGREQRGPALEAGVREAVKRLKEKAPELISLLGERKRAEQQCGRLAEHGVGTWPVAVHREAALPLQQLRAGILHKASPVVQPLDLGQEELQPREALDGELHVLERRVHLQGIPGQLPCRRHETAGEVRRAPELGLELPRGLEQLGEGLRQGEEPEQGRRGRSRHARQLDRHGPWVRLGRLPLAKLVRAHGELHLVGAVHAGGRLDDVLRREVQDCLEDEGDAQ